MNFLQLVQRVRQEARIPGTGPVTTASQTGEMRRLVDWTSSAWTEIQQLHDDWLFMRKEFSFNTIAADGEYTPTDAGITDFSIWLPDTFRCYLTSVGYPDEQWLVEWPYEVFRNTYRFAGNRTQQGRPVVFARRPLDRAIMFGPLPNDIYTVVGEYMKSPTVLTADSDVPGIDEDHQMVIVWKALMAYGLEESASEVIARAERSYMQALASLERHMRPMLQFGGALA